MSAKKCDSSGSLKRKNSKKAVSSGEPVSSRKPGQDSRKPKKARSRRSSTIAAGQTSSHQEGSCDATGKPVKFFLAREGVAFGPYTVFQILESVRLGIFESNDLTLAEDGEAWMEISQMWPLNGARREQPSVPRTAVEDGDAWLEVSELLPLIKAPPGQQQPGKPRFKPLTEQQLREHEMLSIPSPVTAFVAELIRGRFAFAAMPIVVIILGLLTTAAVFKHHETSSRTQAHSRPPQQPPSVQTGGNASPALTRVSLSAHDVPPADVTTVSTSKKLTASTQITKGMLEQRARGGHTP